MPRNLLRVGTLAVVLPCGAVRSQPSVPDSSASPSWLVPILETTAFNAGLAAWNGLVLDRPLAIADPARMRENASSGWEWDDDGFELNQFWHPLQGAAYHSFARANGHGYLGGLAMATVGSVQWQYFGASDPPSLNDVATTRLGGAMLGETSWRLAELLDREASTAGRGAWALRTCAFLANPVRGWSSRRPARRPDAAGEQRVEDLRLATGRAFGKGRMRSKGAANAPESDVPLAATSLRLEYGDPFEAKAPFDHFAFSAGLTASTSPVSDFSIRSGLWALPSFEWGESEHVVRLAQDYDYVNSAIYRVSASSIGIEWIGRRNPSRRWSVTGRIQPLAVLLGAASTEYYVDVERDYNFGWGAGWKAGLAIELPGSARFDATSDLWWIRTESGALGDEIVAIHAVEARKDLWRGFGTGIAFLVYTRQGRYDEHPDASIVNQELRGTATWTR